MLRVGGGGSEKKTNITNSWVVMTDTPQKKQNPEHTYDSSKLKQPLKTRYSVVKIWAWCSRLFSLFF